MIKNQIKAENANLCLVCAIMSKLVMQISTHLPQYSSFTLNYVLTFLNSGFDL